MKKFLKYGVFSTLTFFFLLSVTIMLMPVLVDVRTYVPAIEKKVTELTGRTFTCGPDFSISFFPWISVSFSQMKLGNPPGFISDYFMKVDSLEARISLLSLLKKQVIFNRFVVGGVEINLETNSDGLKNWVGNTHNNALIQHMGPLSWLMHESGSADFMAVTDGRVNWKDRQNKKQYAIEDIMLLVTNLNIASPATLEFSTVLQGNPLTLEGSVGPLVSKSADITIPVDLNFRFAESIGGNLQGTIATEGSLQRLDCHVQVPDFSPRQLLDRLNVTDTILPEDAFSTLAFEFEGTGTDNDIVINKGRATFDETTLDFTGTAQRQGAPVVGFSMDVDRLEFTRYLGLLSTILDAPESISQPGRGSRRDDFLSKLRLDGTMKIGELKVADGTLEDLQLYLHGTEGVYTLDSFTLSAYEGEVSSNITLDTTVQPNRYSISTQGEGIHALPFLKNIFNIDNVSGTLQGSSELEVAGINKTDFLHSLSGEGSFLVIDGVVHGLDMATIAPATVPAVDTTQQTEETQQVTPFTELEGRFAISRGRLTSRKTVMRLASGEVMWSGEIDMLEEKLDLRLDSDVSQNVDGRGEKGSTPSTPPLVSITGSFSEPLVTSRGGNTASRRTQSAAENTEVQRLVDKKLPSPADEDVKDLVGKSLVDPAIIAERFRLQPEVIRSNKTKKQLRLGTGRIVVRPLQEESVLRE